MILLFYTLKMQYMKIFPIMQRTQPILSLAYVQENIDDYCDHLEAEIEYYTENHNEDIAVTLQNCLDMVRMIQDDFDKHAIRRKIQ